MPWLVRDGKVLATIEVATSLRGRTRGLLGRDGIEGAILLRPAKSVHTLRMRFAIDVAFCDDDLVVLKVVTLPRNRVSLPVRKARAVIETEAGMMQKWGVAVGDQLHVRGIDGERDEPAPPAGADRTTEVKRDPDGEPGTAPSAEATGPAKAEPDIELRPDVSRVRPSPPSHQSRQSHPARLAAL